MKRTEHFQANAGTSLIELLIGLTMLTVVMGAIAQVGMSGTRLFREEVQRVWLEEAARTTLDRVHDELLACDLGSLSTFAAWPLWDSALTLDQPGSISRTTGTITWRSTRIELLYEEGEVNDGVDNNGNGLIDEGRVVLIRDWNGPDERTITLCHNVRELMEGEIFNGVDDNGNGLIDERGFCLDRQDSTLNMHLSLEGSDQDGRTRVRSLETSVWLRN
jgi:hypothetical protein